MKGPIATTRRGRASEERGCDGERETEWIGCEGLWSTTYAGPAHWFTGKNEIMTMTEESVLTKPLEQKLRILILYTNNIRNWIGKSQCLI